MNPPRRGVSNPDDMKLTIVIATYNRCQSLLRTLRSLAGQDMPFGEWEVAVVNNNSSDDTDGVVERFRAECPQMNLLLLHESRQGLSPARNCGIESSHGDIIAIIDDDEEVNDGFVSAYCDFFDRYPQATAAGGRVVPRFDCEPPAWISHYTLRPIAGQVDLGESVRLFGGKSYPAGGNMAVRRSAIEKYGVFNPALGRTGNNPMGGEEKDLFDRLRRHGLLPYYVPGAIIYHIIPPEKFTDDYFDRLTERCGVSERVRTLAVSRGAYCKALFGEVVKWGATFVLAAGWLLRGKAAKGRYLLRMRKNITRGLVWGQQPARH